MDTSQETERLKLLETLKDACPVCDSRSTMDFLELVNMPVSIGIQWDDPESAKSCSRGDLRLTFCSACGFIWNRKFNPAITEYSERYDNSLDYSPRFLEFESSLARRLVEEHAIRNKSVIELGCGKGHFLALLCEFGDNRGIGFDPSYQGERISSPASSRITYVRDFYGENHINHAGDLICCRHVFEHIADPSDFLKTVRRTIGQNRKSVVYFEVPNVRFILERLSVWDIIYEHCNYFSRESLGAIFQRQGFDILRLEESYDAQYLSIEARLGDEQSPAISSDEAKTLAAVVATFRTKLDERSDDWHRRLEGYRSMDAKVVIWGAGAKSVSFLNMLQISSEISYVVDINPHKHGKHLPGTGQRIVSPEFLAQYDPQVVILMNPIYRSEVYEQLQKIGICPELVDG
jgi:SAM-dependent methyltransferase